MNRQRSAEIRRFAASALIALPLTVALLFLMTRLILPNEQDSIVTRMIRNIEFQRAILSPDLTGIHVFELPPTVEVEPAAIEQNLVDESSYQTQNQDTFPGETSGEDGPAHVIDWWAEARRLTQESDEALKRWLLEQGYNRYVSIMQGPLPITNSVQPMSPPSQEEATGYLNNYGDLEFKISENCVLQTQVLARNDISDFAKNLPMRVVCKPAPKVKYFFNRHTIQDTTLDHPLIKLERTDSQFKFERHR